MGYMRHHAIVVTSWDQNLLKKAHAKATEIFGQIPDVFEQIAPITPETVNGYVSFLVAPDGSKEGWEHSDSGDKARAEFIEWLDSQRHCDGSTSLDWVVVQFGDDEHVAEIVRHSDERLGQAEAGG